MNYILMILFISKPELETEQTGMNIICITKGHPVPIFHHFESKM